MKLRVRILHGEPDANTAQQIADSLRFDGTPATDLERATVELEAPRRVTWRDEEDDLAALSEKVASGAIRPTDLVHDGSRWMCISDFPPLGDACARAPHHLLPSPEERKAMLWPAIRLALIGLGVAMVIYVALHLH